MMKCILIGIVLATLGISACFSVSPNQPSSKAKSREHTKWIVKILKEIQTIKVGMTRRDLLKVFTTEGGISTCFQRTYVHRECPYIKVNVRFEPINNGRDKLHERPRDKIIEISQPYLQWSIIN